MAKATTTVRLRGVSFANATAAIKADSLNKVDIPKVPFSSFRIGEDQKIRINGNAIKFGELAQRQICTKIKLPFDYFSDIPLDQKIYNWNNRIDKFLAEGEREPEMLVRIKGGKARAVLSNRYGIADNEEVVENLNADEMEKFKWDLTIYDSVMIMNAVTGKSVMPSVKVGDLVPGFRLRNSEVGARSLNVATFLKRLTCTNGMSVPVRGSGMGSSRKHIGDDIYDYVRTEFPNRINRALEDTSNMINMVQNSSGVYIPEFDIQSEQIMLANRFPMRFIKKVQEKIADTYKDKTVFDLTQAITHAAHGEGEDRFEYETNAYSIMKDLLERYPVKA